MAEGDPETLSARHYSPGAGRGGEPGARKEGVELRSMEIVPSAGLLFSGRLGPLEAAPGCALFSAARAL